MDILVVSKTEVKQILKTDILKFNFNFSLLHTQIAIDQLNFLATKNCKLKTKILFNFYILTRTKMANSKNIIQLSKNTIKQILI